MSKRKYVQSDLSQFITEKKQANDDEDESDTSKQSKKTLRISSDFDIGSMDTNEIILEFSFEFDFNFVDTNPDQIDMESGAVGPPSNLNVHINSKTDRSGASNEPKYNLNLNIRIGKDGKQNINEFTQMLLIILLNRF